MLVTAPDRSDQHNGKAASNGSADPVVGTDPGSRADPSSFHRTYPGTNGVLADIRADVARWFTDRGFSVDAVERAVLLVSELASNAIEAGPDHPVHVQLSQVTVHPLGAMITVTNTTLGNVPPPSERWEPADPLAPRGRGLAIVDALSDQVQVDSSVPGRITVTAHLSD